MIGEAGASFLPIDPSVPDSRIRTLLSVSGSKVVLSTSNLKTRLNKFEDNVIIYVDELSPETGINVVAKVEITGDDLCYVIFTSGSTGTPKGVEIMHKSVVNVLESFRNLCSQQDVLLATTTISFDISILEIFLPLSLGAELVIASQSISKDGQQLSSYFNAIKPTIMQGNLFNSIFHSNISGTPSMWQLLLDADWQGSKNLTILCGGEALSSTLASRLLTCSKSLYNVYGPTETCIWSAYEPITKDTQVISLSRALLNTDLFLLDENLKEISEGQVGELFIGGRI